VHGKEKEGMITNSPVIEGSILIYFSLCWCGASIMPDRNLIWVLWEE